MVEQTIAALSREINEQYDNYLRTVDSLLAFAYVMTWDESARKFRSGSAVYQGVRLTNPAGKKVQPDLVIMIHKNIEVVAEIKISFAADQTRWKKDVTQVEGYCVPLKGKIGSSVPDRKHHVAFLIPYELKSKIFKYLALRRAEPDFRVGTPYSAVSFVKASKATDFYIFEKFWEADDKARPSLRLDEQATVPFNTIKTEYGPAVRLIDQEPPLLLLVTVIWDYIFSPKPDEERYAKKRGGALEFKITANEIVDELNRLYSFNSILWKYNKDPSREQGIPQPIRKDWVSKVLKFLVHQKLVEEVDSERHYTVFYKKLRPNTKDNFLTRIAKESMVISERQLKLGLL